MVDSISSWARGIAISVIAVTILEMIVPDNKNKKYVKMIMSIYILFTILSPIVKTISSKDINFGDLLKFNSKSITTTTVETNGSIVGIYENSLKNDIRIKVEEKGYNVINIDVIVENSNNENLGKIYSVALELEKKDISKNSKINTVKIEFSYQKDAKKYRISSEEEREIKKFISSTYGVDENNISIT